MIGRRDVAHGIVEHQLDPDRFIGNGNLCHKISLLLLHLANYCYTGNVLTTTDPKARHNPPDRCLFGVVIFFQRKCTLFHCIGVKNPRRMRVPKLKRVVDGDYTIGTNNVETAVSIIGALVLSLMGTLSAIYGATDCHLAHHCSLT